MAITLILCKFIAIIVKSVHLIVKSVLRDFAIYVNLGIIYPFHFRI